MNKAIRAFSSVPNWISQVEKARPMLASSQTLLDNFQRQHSYLRISLTEKCNLRCTYCMPEEGVDLTANDKLLTRDEIVRLAELFVKQGVKKIRLTGGEPSIRKDLVDITANLNELRRFGLESIGMTSNGIALSRKLSDLKAAGLDSLNVSLDTLDPHKFTLITRRLGFERVLESVHTALKVGIPRVKINCVVIKNVNSEECSNFVAHFKDLDVVVRFIEYMPFTGNNWKDKKLVPYQEIVESLEASFGKLEKLTDAPGETSKLFQIPTHKSKVGFITSMTQHFCGDCNRLRLTADGNLKVCLFGASEVSLRDAMRQGLSDEDLLPVIEAAVKKKKLSHGGMFEIAQSTLNRPMVLIGG